MNYGTVAGSHPRVLIVEDHAILSQSLAMELRLEGIDDVELHTEDFSEAAVLAAVERIGPDVMLLDLHLGEGRLGIPLIAPVKALGASVLMLTASTDRVMLAQCLEAGADGLFNKSKPFDALVSLVRDAALGVTVLKPTVREELLAELREQRRESAAAKAPFAELTKREADVFALVVEGLSADEIAVRQQVTVATVRSHIQSVLRKLGVNSQLAAVALARRAGWTGQ